MSANLTLVSGTNFFSNDWSINIEKIGEQVIYTSSLSDEIDFFYMSILAYNEVLDYLEIVSYSTCFLNKLLEGYSYTEVNETLWNYML